MIVFFRDSTPTEYIYFRNPRGFLTNTTEYDVQIQTTEGLTSNLIGRVFGIANLLNFNIIYNNQTVATYELREK